MRICKQIWYLYLVREKYNNIKWACKYVCTHGQFISIITVFGKNKFGKNFFKQTFSMSYL